MIESLASLFLGLAIGYALGFRRGFRRALRPAKVEAHNVIDGCVLPVADDPRWEPLRPDSSFLQLDGVRIFASEQLPDLYVHGVGVTGHKATQYCRAVLRNYRQRKSVEQALSPLPGRR